MSWSLKKLLKKIKKPKKIYCAVPSLSSAKVLAKYAKKNNIEFIIDIQDLWPEAFFTKGNKQNFIARTVIKYINKQANYIYKNTDYAFSVSETYLNRVREVNPGIEGKAVYIGTDLTDFDKYTEFSKNEKEYFDIGYVGSLGHSYDIKLVIDALEKIENVDKIKNIRFIIIGDGILKNEFINHAKYKNVNAVFKGNLPYKEMVSELSKVDIVINPIVKKWYAKYHK